MFGPDLYDAEYEQEQMYTEADYEWDYVQDRGYEHPDLAWILTPRDVWYKNPYYEGPEVPHPEDYDQ